MSRKIKDFIKIVAALLAVVAVVGLMGSVFSKKDGGLFGENESGTLEEESTEPEVVIDHSNCENEHNWSLYTTTKSGGSLASFGYLCGVCNTLIHPAVGFGFANCYHVFDLSKSHRYSNSTGLTSHFNYANSGSFLYISSKAAGEQVTTSFPEFDLGYSANSMRYLALCYRVSDPDATDLTLELIVNGEINSFTVDSPFTNGWVYVVLDMSGLDGYPSDPSNNPFSLDISFTHTSTLDISFIGLGDNPELVRDIPGYCGTYYDRGSDFASVGTPVNVE